MSLPLSHTLSLPSDDPVIILKSKERRGRERRGVERTVKGMRDIKEQAKAKTEGEVEGKSDVR